MYFGRILGTVWATVKDPSLTGKKLMLVQPQNSKQGDVGEPLVAVDLTDAGPGEHIYYITSREAADAIEDVKMAPVDATIVGIVDRIDRPEEA
jgi:ethanolamine utilization protein EutN